MEYTFMDYEGVKRELDFPPTSPPTFSGTGPPESMVTPPPQVTVPPGNPLQMQGIQWVYPVPQMGIGVTLYPAMQQYMAQPIGLPPALGQYSNAFSAMNFAQLAAESSQQLILPPCSPQKLLEFRGPPQVESNHLVPFPDTIPPPSDREVVQVQPPTGLEVDNGEPAQFRIDSINAYIEAKFSVLDDQVVSLEQYSGDLSLAINNLREACFLNEKSVLEKFDKYWEASESAFQIFQSNFKTCTDDLTSFRETFHRLVQEYLPDQFLNLQKQIGDNWKAVDEFWEKWEKVYREIPQRLQDTIHFCNQVFASQQQLGSAIAQLQGYCAVGSPKPDSSQILALEGKVLELSNQFRNYVGMIEPLSTEIARLRKVCDLDRTQVTKHDLSQLERRLEILEENQQQNFDSRKEFREHLDGLKRDFQCFSASLQRSVSDSQVFVRNLESRISGLESNNPDSTRAVSKFSPGPAVLVQPGNSSPDLSVLWSQTHKTVGQLVNRIQFLDQFLVGVDSRVKSSEDNYSALRRSIVPSQRIERIEEDMSTLIDSIRLFENFSSSLNRLQETVSQISGKVNLQSHLTPPLGETTSTGASSTLQILVDNFVQGPGQNPVPSTNTVSLSQPQPGGQILPAGDNSPPQATGPTHAVTDSAHWAAPVPVHMVVPAVTVPGQDSGPLSQQLTVQVGLDAPPVRNAMLPLGQPSELSKLTSDAHEVNLLCGLSKSQFSGVGPSAAVQKTEPATDSSPLNLTIGEEDSSNVGSYAQDFPGRAPGQIPGAYQHRDFKTSLTLAKRHQPKWDGQPLTWADFWRKWEYYWQVRSQGQWVDPEIKKMEFVDCLPSDEVERATHAIVADRITFDQLVEKYRSDCTSLVPRFLLEEKWRNCVPENRKWRTIDLWYSKWTRLAAAVEDLTDKQKIEQFDLVLLEHQGNLIKLIHEYEIMGQKFSLEQRWNFISNKLRVNQVMSSVNSAFQSRKSGTSTVSALQSGSTQQYRSRSPGKPATAPSGSPIVCYRCGKEGHKQSECRATPRSRSPGRGNPSFRARSPGRGKGKGRSRQEYRRGSRSPSRSGRSGSSPHKQRGRSPQRYSRSPHRRSGSSSGRSNSSHSRSSHTSRGQRGDQRKAYYPDRRHKMIQRQKEGRCIHCGGGHKSTDCSRRRSSSSRPPTPRPNSSYHRQKVNFKRVSGVSSDPLASGREGDEVDDEEAAYIVDEYLAGDSQEIDPFCESDEDYDTEIIE